MAGFRDIKTLQKFASAHASIHNHFNHDRHLNRRDIFKQNRSAALAEWPRAGAQTNFQTSRYKAVATHWTLL
jgi:putative transposase